MRQGCAKIACCDWNGPKGRMGGVWIETHGIKTFKERFKSLRRQLRAVPPPLFAPARRPTAAAAAGGGRLFGRKRTGKWFRGRRFNGSMQVGDWNWNSVIYVERWVTPRQETCSPEAVTIKVTIMIKFKATIYATQLNILYVSEIKTQIQF